MGVIFSTIVAIVTYIALVAAKMGIVEQYRLNRSVHDCSGLSFSYFLIAALTYMSTASEALLVGDSVTASTQLLGAGLMFAVAYQFYSFSGNEDFLLLLYYAMLYGICLVFYGVLYLPVKIDLVSITALVLGIWVKFESLETIIQNWRYQVAVGAKSLFPLSLPSYGMGALHSVLNGSLFIATGQALGFVLSFVVAMQVIIYRKNEPREQPRDCWSHPLIGFLLWLWAKTTLQINGMVRLGAVGSASTILALFLFLVNYSE